MGTLGRLLCLLGLQFVASAAIATTIIFNPGFESNNQSMWAPGPAAGPPPGRMADLLATRAYVADVREWPFDAPTLTRFVLFLLIPLGSWLGGAIVERALAAVLD